MDQQTPDHELHARMQRAQQAQEVLNNPVYEESWTQLEQALMQAWKDSPDRDVEGRERLTLMVKLLNKQRANLEEWIQTGKLARDALDYRKTMRDRLKEWSGLNF